MKKYQFEIQMYGKVEYDGENAMEARDKLLEDLRFEINAVQPIKDIINNSYVSDGKEI